MNFSYVDNYMKELLNSHTPLTYHRIYKSTHRILQIAIKIII